MSLHALRIILKAIGLFGVVVIIEVYIGLTIFLNGGLFGTVERINEKFLIGLFIFAPIVMVVGLISRAILLKKRRHGPDGNDDANAMLIAAGLCVIVPILWYGGVKLQQHYISTRITSRQRYLNDYEAALARGCETKYYKYDRRSGTLKPLMYFLREKNKTTYDDISSILTESSDACIANKISPAEQTRIINQQTARARQALSAYYTEDEIKSIEAQQGR